MALCGKLKPNKIEPESKETEPYSSEKDGYGSFFFWQGGKEEKMKENRYATNSGGVIKAPKPVKNQPKSTITKGNPGKDLRNGK